jgi:hypothetical protein
MEQAGGGKAADQLLHGGRGQARLLGKLPRRKPGALAHLRRIAGAAAAVARRCGHDDDGIVRHARKAHCPEILCEIQIGLIRSGFN